VDEKRKSRCILVVASETVFRGRIARMLHSGGYAVELAADRNRAVKLVASVKFDAVIVVVNSTASTELARELRDVVPRLIVVGDAREPALRSGHSSLCADAFLFCPLHEQELLARLADLLAPIVDSCDDIERLWFEGRCLDLAARTFVDVDGSEVALTRSEAILLATFIRKPHRVLSRDDLCRVVAGRGSEPYERTIDVLVARLRRKIEPDPKTPRFILTVSGGGYKFTLSAELAEARSDFAGTIPSETRLPSAPLNLGDRRLVFETAPVTLAAGQFSPTQPESEARQITVLSLGFASTTVLAENFDLEDVHHTVRTFQQACTAVITQLGGSIAMWTSEEALALFGYPQAHEDDAERAVQAGLELLAKVAALHSHAGGSLQVQVGIATGPVVIDEDHPAIGEAPLIAARLRVGAAPNSIIITARTRRLIGRVFDCTVLSPCSTDEASEPIKIYRVTARRAAQTRFHARQVGEPTKMVGREREMEHLLLLWKRAKAGNAQVVLLNGEAGIGKSRVCEAFLSRVETEAQTAIRCQCSALRSDSPFYPIIQQLEDSAGIRDEDTPDTKLNKLETMLSLTDPGLLADAPLYARLLSIPTNGRYSPLELTAQRQKDLLIRALIRNIICRARKQPLIMKLADAHWVDSSTLELFDRIVSSVVALQILIIVSFRPEFSTNWLDQSHVTLLPLNRLSREQIRAIILAVAKGKKLPDQVCEQIITKADGVPLFAEELTTAVFESGLLEERESSTGPSPNLAIPATLADSLTARLDKLGPAKEVAQVGAAIGRDFSYLMLEAFFLERGRWLKSALDHLIGSGLIFVRGEPPNSSYTFKHALIQDAAYATLLRSKRRALHESIAKVLENTFPEIIQTQPELVGHHFALAGLNERGINYLRKAGQRMIEQSANAEAINQLTRALRLVRLLEETPERSTLELDLEVMLGQAMIASRGYAAMETKEVLLRARVLIDDSTDPSQKFSILYGIWACAYVGGVLVEQQAVAAELRAQAKRHSDTAALCVAHRVVGTTCVTGGNFTSGLQHLRRAHALYEPDRHAPYLYRYGQDIGVAAQCYLSWALWHLGYVDQAYSVADAAVQRAERLGHPHTLVYALCHARAFMGIFGRCAEHIQSCADLVVALCSEYGFSHWINCGRIFQGWAAVSRGEFDRGISILEAGVAAWRNTGARLWLPTFAAMQAEAYARAGNKDAALQAIERAIMLTKETGECWAEAEILRVNAGLQATIGSARSQEIESLLLRALNVSRRQRAKCFELRAACDLARVWQRQNQHQKAFALLRSTCRAIEGSQTADLKEVKVLLEELSS
jgi:DNA-binding response OmpR family regulator/class 3 adenylate cyclase/predicted ATPase